MNSGSKFATLMLVLAFLSIPGRPASAVQDQSAGDQEKSDKDQKAQEKEKKKKGGFFSGLKEVSGGGSEQKELTATAGSKGVGEGEDIGKIQPTSVDRAAVSAMESYSVPEPEVKKFQTDGRLKSAK